MHLIKRDNLFEDTIKLFSDESITKECPLDIKFDKERALHMGGVTRDMLSGFWEEAYIKYFDCCSLLTPVIHPQMDMEILPILGGILSHGYLAGGFIPIRITFPTLACLLLGPSSSIPDTVLLDTFQDSLSEYEAGTVKEALQCSSSFSQKLTTKLVGVFSRFGNRTVPNGANIKQVILSVARYEFLIKPLAAISQMHSGIPVEQGPFWLTMSVKDLHSLYLALTYTPSTRRLAIPMKKE